MGRSDEERMGQVVPFALVRAERSLGEDREGPVPEAPGPAFREAETHARYLEENLQFLLESFDEVLQLLREVPMAADGRIRAADCAALQVALERLEPTFLEDEIPQALLESIQGVGRIRQILHQHRRPRGGGVQREQ